MLFLLGHGNDAVICPTHKNIKALSGEISGVAGVIRVQMGEKNVGVVCRQTKLPHSAEQSLAAFRAIKPGVDKQIPAAGAYNIAVEPLERIVRQNDRKGVYIIRYLFNVHGGYAFTI